MSDATNKTISYERIVAGLSERYPATAASLGGEEGVRARLLPTLLCPRALPLSRALADEASSIVRAFWSLRSLPEWKTSRAALAPVVRDPGHSSVLMSYDFHVDATGRLRLIEINTNASMSLFADLQYELQGLKNPYSPDFRNEIISTFERERGATPRSVVITDETPDQQRMFIEFLMFQELMRSRGWATEIADTRELVSQGGTGGDLKYRGTSVDLVYNRNTDFYLQGETTQGLREARTACITPNPFEYRLLADKERLLELSRPGALEALALSEEHRAVIAAALIRTLSLREVEDKEALWKERKKWFFKPMRSFGSKAAYRGSSVTKGTWARLLEGEYVAQEYVPAPEVDLGDGAFKYDLRFYVYEDRIQLAAARLYQGQTTNSQTPGGGLAAIRWT